MTNTENTSAAEKPAGRKTNVASEPTATTAPQTTVERRGVSGGILIGAIGASLVGGLLIGGGTGALITRTIDLGERPALAGQGDHQGGGMPGQQQGGQPGGPQGGLSGGPQHGQNGPSQQQGDENQDSGDSGSTDAPETGTDSGSEN